MVKPLSKLDETGPTTRWMVDDRRVDEMDRSVTGGLAFRTTVTAVTAGRAWADPTGRVV